MDSPETGGWWRFTKYALDASSLERICPARQSVLRRYDPWREFRESRDALSPRLSGKRTSEPPYQALFDLIEIDNENKRVTLNHQKTMEWCSRYGLLGLLPHQALLIWLPPRWAKFGKLAAADRNWRKLAGFRGELVPQADRYFRTSTGWKFESRFIPAKSYTSACLGDPVSETDLPTGYQRPGVIWADLKQSNTGAESLKKLAPFLGEGIEPFECPPILTDGFWKRYGEPVDFFLNAIVTLYGAVTTIAKNRRDTKKLDRKGAVFLADAIVTLSALAAPASAALTFANDRSGLQQRWVAPSLLSSLALMAQQDLATGSVRICANETCRQLFTSSAYNAVSCGEKCRNTKNKRTWRKKPSRKS